VQNYHHLSKEDVLRELGVTDKGISSDEAARRLHKYGPNILQETKKISPFKIFVSQFNNFIIYILIAAVAVSAFLGEYVDSFVIFLILLGNAVLGFIQEFRAEKSIEALRKLAGLKAKVFRDGSVREVDASELVPGDVIQFEVGEKLSADARVIEAVNLETQEASLTGESSPVKKTADALGADIPLADRRNMVFSGTVVTAGRGRAVVCFTGMQTEIGKIATMIQEVEVEATPLQKKLEELGKWLGYATIVICIVVFAGGLLKGGEITRFKIIEMFMVGVSLAVAAIPEGLPAVVTIALALGVQRMVKRNALIRRLPSVETLGCATVICSDKTGTITCNVMTVRSLYVNGQTVVVSGAGSETSGSFTVGDTHEAPRTPELELLLKIGALNNDAVVSGETFVGDPTEWALVISAAKAGISKEDLQRKYPRIEEIGFDSERKRMTTVHLVDGRKVAYMKGAAEVVLGLCTRIAENGKVVPLTDEARKRIVEKNRSFADSALRVLGFAYKEVAERSPHGDDPANRRLAERSPHGEDLESDMIFVGMQAMIDPPREEVKRAIEKCTKAGIKVVMITGDYELTAKAVAREVGLHGDAISGKELEKKTDLAQVVEDLSIYARVNPEHKIRIVDLLKGKGHVVAMTGDGVNDAPALKKADLGIAMGVVGTDVAREASGMILTDDNFASIVNAIEEGRGIYDNIKKFVGYLLSCNLGEVITIFTAMLIGFVDEGKNLVLPLTAVQILWMNLVTDGLPALALGLDPIDKKIMERPPRKPGERIVSNNMMLYILFIGAVVSAATLGIFWWGLHHKTVEEARTLAFTTIVVMQLVSVQLVRMKYHVGVFSNRYLIGAVLASFGLQLAVIYTPLSKVFKTVPLNMDEWGAIALICAVTFVAGAAFVKLISRITKQID